MDHQLGPEVGERLLDEGRIRDVALAQLQAGHFGHHLALAGGEVVQHQDLVALGQPVLDEVGSEAAGAAGQQDPRHFFSSCFRCVKPPEAPCLRK